MLFPRKFLKILLLVFITAALPVSAAEPDWSVIENWIDQQKDLVTLWAQFTQTRSLPSVRNPISKPGRLWFDRDGRLRWELGDPARMIVLRRGEEFLLIDTKRQVARRVDLSAGADSIPPEARPFLALRFPMAESLANFRELFEVREMDRTEDAVTLQLLPRQAEARRYLQSLRITFDKERGLLREFALVFEDDTEIRTDFTEIKTNGRFAEGTFAFDLKGYRVQTLD